MKLNKKEVKEEIKAYIGTDFYKVVDEAYPFYKENGYIENRFSDELIDSIVNKIKNRKAFGRNIEFRAEYEIRDNVEKSVSSFVEWFNSQWQTK